MRLNRALLAALAGPALIFALACGGDSEDDPSADAYAPSGSGDGAQLVDISRSAANLEALRSFRFDVSMKLDFAQPSGDDLSSALAGLIGDIKVTGAYVAPDSLQVETVFAGEEIAYVQIGSQAWTKVDGAWQVTPADATPNDLFQELLPQEVLRAAKTSSEKVNGVEATRYSFDKESLLTLAALFGEGPADLDDVSEVTFDLWLTDANIPVKLVIAVAGQDENGQDVSVDLELNIRDINSSSIEIEPPI